ncbi:unannotated protein [freshwater metagenome]|uniref:Unannotated protein n=1 Tax=freshwater metagenome TaxID=449393 RepID=A0A6J7GH97_9ZZZZ|nr:ArsR family transcriptional regulator [Actinomycetota bacterium]
MSPKRPGPTPTQRRVLDAVVRLKPCSPEDVAADVGLTLEKTRQHLSALGKLGLVQSTGRLRGRAYTPAPLRPAAPSAAPGPGALPRVPGRDGRPLTSHLLDVLARAQRPVELDELVDASGALAADVHAAVQTLICRGRIRRNTTGALVWERPERMTRRPEALV